MDKCETQERARKIQGLMETAGELLLGMEFTIRDKIMYDRVCQVDDDLAHINAAWEKIREEL